VTNLKIGRVIDLFLSPFEHLGLTELLLLVAELHLGTKEVVLPITFSASSRCAAGVASSRRGVASS
jgi:hypothetical protein